MNTCYCNTVHMVGIDRMDFYDFVYYRDHFSVVLPAWASGAAVGGAVPTLAFFFAIYHWTKCRDLWRDGNELGLEPTILTGNRLAWLL
jgi:hypothetical protein